MLCRQHGYPWPSLATSPYRSSLLAGFQGYMPYPHIAALCTKVYYTFGCWEPIMNTAYFYLLVIGFYFWGGLQSVNWCIWDKISTAYLQVCYSFLSVQSTLSVTVIMTGNGYGKSSSNPGGGCLHLLYFNAFWKGMNLSLLTSAMCRLVSLAVVKQYPV